MPDAAKTVRMKLTSRHKQSVRYDALPDTQGGTAPILNSVYLMNSFAPGADQGKMPEAIEVTVKEAPTK